MGPKCSGINCPAWVCGTQVLLWCSMGTTACVTTSRGLREV